MTSDEIQHLRALFNRLYKEDGLIKNDDDLIKMLAFLQETLRNLSLLPNYELATRVLNQDIYHLKLMVAARRLDVK